MKTKPIKPFYVIVEDVNRQEFVKYDVMPYFVNEYKEARPKDKPITQPEFAEFVENKSLYMYWSRCEYELLLKPWIGHQTKEEKIDVHYQIMNNIDIVVDLLMQNVGK